MSNSNDGTGRALSIVKRIALGVVGFIAVACLVGGVAVFALFGNELKTLDSIKKIDEYPLYTMDYVGDYGIDEFLEQGGASNDAELIDFVVGRLLKACRLRSSCPISPVRRSMRKRLRATRSSAAILTWSSHQA